MTVALRPCGISTENADVGHAQLFTRTFWADTTFFDTFRADITEHDIRVLYTHFPRETRPQYSDFMTARLSCGQAGRHSRTAGEAWAQHVEAQEEAYEPWKGTRHHCELSAQATQVQPSIYRNIL